MPVTALKTRRRREEEPAPAPIPNDRAALAKAIEAKQKASRAVADQEQAIARVREMVWKAEDELEKLRAKIAKADETDDARAATLLKNDKPITSAWSGDSARRSVTVAEERIRITQRARKRLEAELVTLRDDVAEADNVIWVCIRRLAVPLVQQLITKFHEQKRAAMVTMNVLSELTNDDTRRAPRFQDATRDMRATDERSAVLKPFKAETAFMTLAQADQADYAAIQQAVSELKVALTALQTDANAELPKV
jgi:hypothetical protein